MESGAWILRRLGRWGKPSPGRHFLASFVRLLDVAFLLLPVAALAVRWKLNRAEADTGPFGWLVLAAMILPALGALALLVVRRGDPLAAARGLDAHLDRKERVLTAAHYASDGRHGRLVPLLLRDVARELKAIAAARPVRSALRPPAFFRAVLAAVLAFLILLVPPFERGLLGPERADAASSDPASDMAGGGDAEAPGLERPVGFAGKVEVSASTDRLVYVLGEEIELTVKLKTLQPLPDGVALDAVVKVDGDRLIDLPVDWTLPAQPGETREGTFELKARLKVIDKYRRGLLALDTFVFPKEERDDLLGAAPGPRVVIQISENTEKARTRTPTPVEKKRKPKPKPQDRKPKKDKKPDESPNRRPKKPEKKAPSKAPAPPAPDEIDTLPFVIEPLFSGDQSTERDIPVFDRDEENADRPPPDDPRRRSRTRGYQRGEEAEMKRLRLGGRERRLVRRYLDGIRQKR